MKGNGTAERESTLAMLNHLERRHSVRPATLGADKGYDAGPFMVELEKRWIEPHVAIKSGKIDPLGDRADEGTWARWFARSERSRAPFKKTQRRRMLAEEFSRRCRGCDEPGTRDAIRSDSTSRWRPRRTIS
jgi:hypothetical protein